MGLFSEYRPDSYEAVGFLVFARSTQEHFHGYPCFHVAKPAVDSSLLKSEPSA
jgi:hypothetical protein